MSEILEKSFETVIETHLLANGYVAVSLFSFDREWAIFAQTVLAFNCETQRKETVRLDALATATERSIALLKERRATLIAAAVTGQLPIPVPELKGAQPC